MDYTVDIVFKKEYTRLIALLIRKYGHQNLSLIEDAVQESFLKAVKIWPVKKPDNPSAWIMRVAKNHLLDQFKKADFKYKQQLITQDHEETFEVEMVNEQTIIDSQLRMIFACCHPKISRVNQLLLSLKFLCGFGNNQIARALLKTPVAIEKAINRAKQKFKTEIGSFEIPDIEELKGRLTSVLKVIYLQFNEGYKLSSGDSLINKDLCLDAIKLAEFMAGHKVFNLPEVNALLAIMYFHASRFDARLNENNELVTLEFQNRSKWNQHLILQGNIYLGRASRGDTVSKYHLEAIIASYHATAPKYSLTNWQAIYNIYEALLEINFNKIYYLNQLIAYSQFNSIESTLSLVHNHIEKLPDNHILFVFIGNLKQKSGKPNEARQAYSTALEKVTNELEKQFIQKKIDQLN